MKKLFGLALLAGLMIAPFGMAEDTTLSGEPVDINCFLGGKSGEGHASCAKSCAERGNPIGFLVKSGDEEQLYLVIGSGGKAAKDLVGDHMGKQVEVSGAVSEKGGMKVIAVSSVSAS